MKLNFKNIIIIFLVALLGGGLGTYGVLKVTESDRTTTQETSNENASVITETLYANKETGSYEAAINKAINTVVEITSTSTSTTTSYFGQSQESESTSLGSGVIISSDGYIVTCNHVVEGASSVTVKTNDGIEYEATIVGTDSKTDLAVLKIEATNLQYSTFVDSESLAIGQEVLAIGNSLGKGTSSTNGIISALDRNVTINNYSMTLILTNAEVNSGNSGGGLFDMDGNLVGIVNAKIMSSLSSSSTTSVEGMGYAIPTSTVKKIVDELMNNGYVKNRATLGVKVISDNSYLSYYGYSNVDGAVVSEVVSGGAAEKAGIKSGDVIIAIDGNKVSSFTDLSSMLDNYNVGDKAKVTVERDNQLKEFEVTFEEYTQETTTEQ